MIEGIKTAGSLGAHFSLLKRAGKVRGPKEETLANMLLATAAYFGLRLYSIAAHARKI